MLRAENLVPALGGLASLGKSAAIETLSGSFARVKSIYVHRYPTSIGGPDDKTEFYHLTLDGTGVDRIYTVNLSTHVWSDISRGGGYGSSPNDTSPFSFASYGNDIWAVDLLHVPQRRTANTGNFANGVTSSFVPEGRFIAVIRGFMAIAHLRNGRLEDEIAWSDVGNPLNYTTGGSSTAGSVRATSRPGAITGFLGGEYGRVWKETALYALSFVGGEDIWRLDELAGHIGTTQRFSIVECRDGMVRWWSGDQFYEQSGTGAPVPIANSGIVDLLLSGTHVGSVALDATAQGVFLHDNRMIGVEGEAPGLVFWFYRSVGDAASLTPKHWVAYNYLTKEWSHGVLAEGIWAATSDETKHPPAIILGQGTAAPAVARHEFSSTTQYGVTLATQRFVVGQGEAEGQAQHVHVDGIMPVVTLPQATYGSDYRLATLPTGFSVRLVASNEPHFQQQTDVGGTQISPRSESYTVADLNDVGFLPFALAGRHFVVEVTGPESTTVLRGLRGAWISYRVIA